MVTYTRPDTLSRLKNAAKEHRLALYLGAGVSIPNGLPSWDQLVLAVYFSALKADLPVRAFPNYLFAIAEWELERRHEPLEITARKIRNLYSPDDFLEQLRHSLYAGFKYPGDQHIQRPDRTALFQANATLKAIASLCKTTPQAVRAVVSYNYDCLLELVLEGSAHPIWHNEIPANGGLLPVYHVHGYVPIPELSNQGQSRPEEIIFTEEQYHRAAEDAYSWSNIVQLHALTSSVGIMIGLSLTDRNLRRILDAIRRAPLPCENYALLQRPKRRTLEPADAQRIGENAQKYYTRFRNSGIKTEDRAFAQVEHLLNDVQSLDFTQQESILTELGITVIWYDEHTEIPGILESITQVSTAA